MIRFSVFIFAVGLSLCAEASRLGQFEISKIQLQGYFGGASAREQSNRLFNSHVGFSWKLVPNYLAYIEIGDMSYQTDWIWDGTQSSNLLGLRSAYLEYQSTQIGFRYGLIPSVFGYESVAKHQPYIFIPRMAYENAIWGKLNQGFEIFWSFENWFTNLQAHRPSLSSDSDQSEPWVTGRFGYQPRGALGLWVTAQSGKLKPAQMTGAGTGPSDRGLDFDPNKATELRQAAITLMQDQNNFNGLFEWGKGETKQLEQDGFFQWSTLDLRYLYSKNWGVYFRIDQFSPFESQQDYDSYRRDFGFIFQGDTKINQWAIFARDNQPGLGFGDRQTELWLHLMVSAF